MQLDQFQELVVDSPVNANLLVIGAPGSGKTLTLTTRYANLYINGGLDTSRMLVLTFSKKAAAEMSKRINKTIDLSAQAKGQISTINAFCHRVYNSWREGNGLKPLKIWQYGDKVQNPNYKAAELMQQYLKTSDLSVFDAINKTLSSHPEPKASHLADIDILGPRAELALKLWTEYQVWMKENGLVDFYGQVWNLDRLMFLNPIFASMLGQRFDKIMADEVQDMFPQSYRIMLRLAEESSLEMFGDSSQSIYGFNGAAPHLMYEIEERIEDLLVILHLSKNYRSNQKIVDVVNDFGPNTTYRFKPMFCSTPDKPGQIMIKGVKKMVDQADYIAEQILENDYNYNDIYVLARTNGQCATIYQRLLQLGIPANYASNFSIWDKTHVKAAMSYMAIMKDQDGPDDLGNILNIPSDDHVNKFGPNTGRYTPSRFLPRVAFTPYSFKDLFTGNFTATRPQRPGVSNILKFVDRLKGLDDDRQRTGDIGAAISKWAQWSGLDHSQVEDDLSMVWDKLENLDYSVDKLRIYIQKMNEAKRKIKPGLNKVEVMTIHQAKGLEALIVFLVGLSEPEGAGGNSGFHPGRNTNPNINEENCLFYVGISRAIAYLYLLYYKVSGETTYDLSSFVSQYMKEVAKYGTVQR